MSKTWTKTTILNSRNQKLAGLYYTGGKENTPTLIICHGFTGSKEGQGSAIQMAEYFGQANFDILLFDFSGNGESEGNFEDLTLSNQIGDLNSVIDWCKQHGAGTIITMGRSFGGSTVICHAASDKRVAGVCSWAAPARLVELFTGFVDEDPDNSDKFILAGEEGILYIKKSFFEDLKMYDVPANASRVAPQPLLVIQGTNDDVVSTEDAELIYNAADDPKELIFIEGGDHQFSDHYQKAWDTTLKWLKKYFSVV